MIKNKFFSRGKLVKAAILFFGALCSLKMLPAAIEPVASAKPTKTVVISEAHDYRGRPFIIHFRHYVGKGDLVDPVNTFRSTLTNLPKQYMILIEVELPDGTLAGEETLRAHEIAILNCLTVDRSGNIKLEYEQLPQQPLPAATEPVRAAIPTTEQKPGAIQSKPVTISAWPDFRRFFYISFLNDGTQIAVANPVRLDAVWMKKCERNLPHQDICVEVRNRQEGDLINQQLVTADQVARLRGLAFDNSGRIILDYEPEQQPLPVAIPTAEQQPRAEQFKDVIIKSTCDYFIDFHDGAAKVAWASSTESKPGASKVHLPVQNLVIRVERWARDYDTPVRETSITAEEIARLKTLHINDDYSITLDYEPEQQPLPVAVPTAEQQPREKQLRHVYIVSTCDYYIAFRDANNTPVRNPILGSNRNGVDVELPIQDLALDVGGLYAASPLRRRLITDDEIARLRILHINNDYSITFEFECKDKQAPAPRQHEEVKPVAPVPAPDLSHYHEMVKKCDIEGLRAIVPALQQARKIDAADEKGVTALGNAITLYKIVTDMINELLAHDASLFQQDKNGKTPLDYAGDQKDDLLKIMKVTAVCSVCLEKKQLGPLSCGHMACCRECLADIMARSADLRICPLCREPIKP